MTNKIIVDGIDVSECEFFTPISVTALGGSFKTQTYCGQANALSDDNCVQKKLNLHCKNNPNCHFKQLARANEENEKLKAEIFTFEELITIQEKVIANYEHALNKIREYCIETSEDNDAMVGEHLVSDDILDIINKAKEVNNAR